MSHCKGKKTDSFTNLVYVPLYLARFIDTATASYPFIMYITCFIEGATDLFQTNHQSFKLYHTLSVMTNQFTPVVV